MRKTSKTKPLNKLRFPFWYLRSSTGDLALGTAEDYSSYRIAPGEDYVVVFTSEVRASEGNKSIMGTVPLDNAEKRADMYPTQMNAGIDFETFCAEQFSHGVRWLLIFDFQDGLAAAVPTGDLSKYEI